MFYAFFLALTIILEAPIYALGLRAKKGIGYCILFNCFTHPIAWIAIQAIPLPYALKFAGIEALVIAVEAVLLRRVVGISWRKAFAVSLAANAFSAAAGLLL